MVRSAPAKAPPASAARVVFLTRDPVVHQQGGSTTYALGLLGLLRAQGAQVTLVATSAYSRSPRLFFRLRAAPPPGVALCFPGYLRLGTWYLCPWRPKAWARLLARAAPRLGARWPRLLFVRGWLETLYGPALYTGAWDLTIPTVAEGRIASREAQLAGATVVVANYAFWGPLLGHGSLGRRRTAILMHDLLSARAHRFLEAGLPLDCPPIETAEEMRWLSSTHTVLAAQEREAETIRAAVSSPVLVTPVALTPRSLDQKQIIAGRCLFVGSNIVPNQTGLSFLLDAVWPQVRAAVPGATLAVAGGIGQRLGSWDAARLASLGIETLGLVPSLEAEYARAAVCLVPLLVGSGIKIKLLEALAFGKAVVSTPIGVQGLEAWAHEAMEVADDAATFAAAIVHLLTNAAGRRAREAAALRLTETHLGASRPLDPAFVAAVL